MKKEINLTVLIPVFNAEKHIKYALRSVVNQTFKNLKIIISDNGSKDKTFQICRSFKKKYKNIKLIRRKKTISSTKNFMSLLKKASSKFIIFYAHSGYFNNKNYLKRLTLKLTDENIPFGTVIAIDDKNKIVNYQSNYAKLKLVENKIIRRLKFFFTPDILISKNSMIYGIHERSLILKCYTKVNKLCAQELRQYDDNYINYLILKHKKVQFVKNCILHKRLKNVEYKNKINNKKNILLSLILQFKIKYNFMKYSNFFEKIVIFIFSPFYIFIEIIFKLYFNKSNYKK